MSTTIFNQTIRGMTNVSQLATKKFYNRTALEVAQIYFPQATQKKVKNITIHTDTESNKNLLEYVTKRVFFYDKNNNDVLDEDEQLAFNVYIYTSKDAIKLLETFEVSKPGKDDVLLFVEDNTGDSSGQFTRAKVGENVLSNLKNAGHLYNNKKLLERVNEHVTIDEAILSELLENGKIENTTLEILEFLFAIPDWLYLTSINELIMEGIGEACGGIASFIDKAKIDDYRWNPRAKKLKEDGTEDETPEFTPFFFPYVTEALDEIDDSKINEYVQQSTGRLKEMYTEYDQSIQKYLRDVDIGRLATVPVYFYPIGFVNIEVDLVPDSIQAFVYSLYLKAKQVSDFIFDKFQQFDLTDIIKKGIYAANAFICGIWNSIIDAISGIFKLLEMIFKAAVIMNDFMRNISTELPLLLEYIDNYTQALKEVDFDELYKHFKTKLSEFSIFDVPIEVIAYFLGAFVGFVITLIIEVVLGILFTGGTLSVAAIIEKLTSIFTSLVRAGAKVLRKVFNFTKDLAVKTFKGVKSLLQQIINLLRKGTRGLKQMIDDVFKAFGTYSREARGSLNSALIPGLTPAELKLYKNLAKAFIKPFKKLLLKYVDNAKAIRRWKSLRAMKKLSKSEINELLELRKLSKKGFNKNAAIMKAELEINGKVVELEYKALAGRGVNGKNLVQSPNIDQVARELGLPKEEVLDLFKAYDPVNDKTISRFFDSEYKIFSQFDDELFRLQAHHGESAIKIKNINFKTLYEPCMSCKKQMIIRQEIYKFTLKVEATALKGGGFAKGNGHLRDLGLLN